MMGMAQDRRDKKRRGEVVRAVITQVVANRGAVFTVESLRGMLNVPLEGAERILRRLVDAGVIHELSRGTWVSYWPEHRGEHA
jgi:hypothetical protein